MNSVRNNNKKRRAKYQMPCLKNTHTISKTCLDEVIMTSDNVDFLLFLLKVWFTARTKHQDHHTVILQKHLHVIFNLFSLNLSYFLMDNHTLFNEIIRKTSQSGWTVGKKNIWTFLSVFFFFLDDECFSPQNSVQNNGTTKSHPLAHANWNHSVCKLRVLFFCLTNILLRH